MSTSYVAACGMCGDDFPFNTAAEREGWLRDHPSGHHDYVSFYRCQHDSLSGDEGPVLELGRMPTRWRCDQCGTIINDVSTVQAAVVATINTVGEALLGLGFTPITSSPIPDEEVTKILTQCRSEESAP